METIRYYDIRYVRGTVTSIQTENRVIENAGSSFYGKALFRVLGENGWGYYCASSIDMDDKKLKDDTASGEERCNSRVVLRLNDKQYNILNYNCRAMKKETTLKIASYLLKKGLIADIEMLTGYSGNKVLKSIDYNKSSRSIREQSKNMIQSDQSKGKQLSFFDNSAVYKLHTNV